MGLAYAPRMRVATWNVNGLKARLDFLRHWLRSRRPDVLGLQELKLAEEHFPHEALREEGYHAAVHGQKGWNGVAVLSREPARVVQKGLPGQEALGARLLTVEVAGLRFASVYVPNGKHVNHEDFPRKLAWLEALAEHLGKALPAGRDALLCGDLNVVPTELDSWNEEELAGSIFHTEEERALFARLLEPGLEDLFRRHQPEAREYSWWDYRGGAFHKRQGLRIDFLLGTRSVARRLRAASIDREYRKKQEGLTPSDHAPVIADLEEA